MRRDLQIVVLVIAAAAGVSATSAEECTAAGRFPNSEDVTCRGFVICIPDAADSFSRYNLSCPLDTVFNPGLTTCTDAANYTCPSLLNTDLHACTSEGNFENSHVTDCRSFILCSPYNASVLVAKVLECPEGQLFEPSRAVCVNETLYDCAKTKSRANVIQSSLIIISVGVLMWLA